MNTKSFHIASAIWIFAVVAGGFAESFPNRPPAGELEEIVEQGITCGNAVRERGLAVNDAGNFLPYCGHGQSYFASLQQELESLAPPYIDHINGPLNDDEDAFRYFTLATWRTAASLNSSGFRRFIDSTWYYGIMQSGDVIGSWIFEDLQNGFSALEYTLKTGTLNGTGKYGGMNGGNQPPDKRGDLEYMKSVAAANYAACSPFGSSTFEIYSRIFRYQEAWYDCSLSRINGDLSVTGIPEISDVTHTWELYLIAESHDDWNPYGGSGCVWDFDTFDDFTFSPADGTLSIVEEDNTPSSDTFHDVGFGSLTQPPWCGGPAAGIVAFKGYTAREMSFLLKWYFTNANP